MSETTLFIKSPVCEVLHDRLVRLHLALGIAPQVHFWPLPPDNEYKAQYALACWDFGRHFSHDSPVMVGDDPEKLYREMEAMIHKALEEQVREHQDQINVIVNGLKLLLKEHG